MPVQLLRNAITLATTTPAKTRKPNLLFLYSLIWFHFWFTFYLGISTAPLLRAFWIALIGEVEQASLVPGLPRPGFNFE